MGLREQLQVPYFSDSTLFYMFLNKKHHQHLLTVTSTDCGQMKEKMIPCSDLVPLTSLWQHDIAPQIKMK